MKALFLLFLAFSATDTSALEAVQPMLRKEFIKAVMGKSQTEVLKVLGTPDSTTGDETGGWIYQAKTKDPITGKIDSVSAVLFDHGKAVSTTIY